MARRYFVVRRNARGEPTGQIHSGEVARPGKGMVPDLFRVLLEHDDARGIDQLMKAWVNGELDAAVRAAQQRADRLAAATRKWRSDLERLPVEDPSGASIQDRVQAVHQELERVRLECGE